MVGEGEGIVPAPGGSGGLFCWARASIASSNESEKIAQRLIAKSQRWERMIGKATRIGQVFMLMILILLMIFCASAASDQDQEHDHDQEQEY
jgi:hypothetical protein